MSGSEKPKSVDRRKFINYAITSVVTGIVVGLGTYLSIPTKEVVRERTVTVPTTVKETITKTIEATTYTVTATESVTRTELTTPTRYPSKVYELLPEEEVTLKLWALSDYPPEFTRELFMERFPKVKVEVASVDDVPALITALKSGAYMYDVIRNQFISLPAQLATGSMLNMKEYIIPEYIEGLPEFTLKYVAGEEVGGVPGEDWYAIPEDTAPVCLIYRKDIFDKYGLKVPRTWEEYREVGEQLREADKSKWLCEFDTTSWTGQLLMYLMMQAGGNTITPVGRGKYKVEIDSEENRKVIEYWGSLVDDGLVKVVTGWSDEWFRDMSEGNFVALPWGAAWVPGFVLKASFKEQAGLWRIADTLQWQGAKLNNYFFGGSVIGITKQSPNPKAAALFAQWACLDPEAVWITWVKGGLWSANTKLLKTIKEFTEPDPYFGGQKIGEYYIRAQEHIDPENVIFTKYSQSLAFTHIPEVIADAVYKKIKWSEVLPTIQERVIKEIRGSGDEVVT